MILSWSERTISHTRTETRPRLLREAAVRNFRQWAKAWSSNIAWVRKAILVVKLFYEEKIMTKLQKKVPANFVPAAAVRREGQALFRLTGRKEHVGGIWSWYVKGIYEICMHSKPKYLSMKEEGRISCGRVKSVDIWRNTKSEGSPLVHDWRWGVKAWGATGIRYPVSPCSQLCRFLLGFMNSGSQLTQETDRLGSTIARLKLKGIDGGPHKWWSMWFNAKQRAEPYQSLTYCICYT